ncbi:hypothetical protein K457DRAFT_341450 [Linnemannia elongata AG-77]|uniref:RNI-like protein n=1 Tax=Linnemannia elongata AG-77 TaxID=1314771 RepID=A0A197K2Y4_9FUNG|nr:hypothetical protein K457DRAFT_341450 [Linnemannia elongata AG-77]
MLTACQRFFDIPELTASLDPFLSTNDRIHLLTTSRSLHKVFAPLCWSHLDMKPTVTTARLFKSPDGMDALGRYVRSVQSLEASSPFFKTYMESVLAFMHSQRLEGLSLSDTGTGGEGAEAVAGTGTGAVIVPPKWLLPLPIQAMKPETFMPPTPPMRNLTRLNCALTRLDMDGDKLGLRQSFQICWLLRLNPGLTHLNLVNMALCDARLVRVLGCTLAGLPRLKNLYLESSYHMALRGLTELFLSCPVSLVVLSLHFYVEYTRPGLPHAMDSNTLQDAADDDDEGFKVIRRNGPLPNLTRLIMPTHQGGFTMPIIELFLQDCPFLQMWGVPHLDRQHTFREVSTLLLRHCPNLRELTCKDGTIRRRDFLEVIRGMPTNQLETLALIRYSEQEPGELWGALERHREVFCQLILFNALGVSSGTMAGILRSCPSLTRLIVMAVDDREVALTLKDAAEYSWTCLNLTHVCLLMDLSGTRSEEKYTAALTAKKSGTLSPFIWTKEEQACWKQLKSVYTQLGSLIHLNLLTLRHVLSKSLPGLLTLGDPSMNQPGFLDKLSGWKKLKSFRGSVSAFTPESQMMLRQEEVEWMEREWPVLELIAFSESKVGINGIALGHDSVDLPLPLQWFKSRKPSIKFH